MYSSAIDESGLVGANKCGEDHSHSIGDNFRDAFICHIVTGDRFEILHPICLITLGNKR